MNRWLKVIVIVIIIIVIVIVIVISIVIVMKVVMNRWQDDVTGFVSIVVERLEGVFLVLRPEDSLKEEPAVRFPRTHLSAWIISTIVMMVEMIKLAFILFILVIWAIFDQNLRC